MGLFSYNYSKPGPGVNPNEPEKKGFFRFWEVIFEKWSKLLGASAFQALLSIPYIVILYLIAPVGVDWINKIAGIVAADGADIEMVSGVLMMSLRMIFAVGIFVLWGSGPASAMYAYITRCFTRRDPVWVISDGFDKFKENFKQGMLIVILDLVILFFGFVALSFYYGMYKQTGSNMWMLLTSLMGMLLLVYTWMHYYIYQIMVTFECTFRQLLKNSVLFAIAMLPMNVLLTVIAAGIVLALFIFIGNPMLAAVLALFIAPLITRFPIEFSAARKINKTIIQAQKKAMPKKQYINEETNKENK